MLKKKSATTLVKIGFVCAHVTDNSKWCTMILKIIRLNTSYVLFFIIEHRYLKSHTFIFANMCWRIGDGLTRIKVTRNTEPKSIGLNTAPKFASLRYTHGQKSMPNFAKNSFQRKVLCHLFFSGRQVGFHEFLTMEVSKLLAKINK